MFHVHVSIEGLMLRVSADALAGSVRHLLINMIHFIIRLVHIRHVDTSLDIDTALPFHSISRHHRITTL